MCALWLYTKYFLFIFFFFKLFRVIFARIILDPECSEQEAITVVLTYVFFSS